ncbi:MAG: alpha/beta fold hydrolase [Acidobacteriota bacterium]
MIIEHQQTVQVSDGTHFGTHFWQPDTLADDAPVALCLPAMGVRASYYRPLAEALCGQGFPVVTADLRGLGSSSVRASRLQDFGYLEIVERDLPALLDAVKARHPDREVFALGHSLGGQIACLTAAAEPGAINGLILVASCSVYYGGYAFPKSLFVLLFEQSAALSARILGYFPGRLVRFGDREARRLVRDWAHQGRTGRYEVQGSSRRYEALLAASRVPLLAVSFADDSYAPRRAVEHLLAKMPRADRTHHHLDPKVLGSPSVGHFGWVKRADQLAPRLTDWISGIQRQGSEPSPGLSTR